MLQRQQDTSELAGALRYGAAVLAAFALYTNIVEYWHAAHGGLRPLFVIGLVTAAGFGSMALQPRRAVPVLRSPLLAWICVYLLMSTAWSLWRPVYSLGTDQALIDRYRSMALLLGLAIAFDHPGARRVGRIGVLIAAAFACLVNLAEASRFISFVDLEHRTAGRTAGFYVNPNLSGIAIVLGLAASITVLPRVLRMPMLALGLLGVSTTLSRGALACFAALALLLIWQRAIGLWATLAALVAVGAFALQGGGARIQRFFESGGTLNQDVLARLQMRADDSGRSALATKVWRMFLDAPWLGNGLAAERHGRMSHNLYLSLGAEHGVLGFLIAPAFAFALALRRSGALPFCAVFLLGGLINHGLLENDEVMICAALVAGEPARSRNAGTGSNDPGDVQPENDLAA